MSCEQANDIILLSGVIAEVKNYLPGSYSNSAKAEGYIKFQQAVAKYSKKNCSKCRALVKEDLAHLYWKALMRVTKN